MWQTEVKHGTNQELEQHCTAHQIHYICCTGNWISLAEGLQEKGMQLSEGSQRGNKWCRQPTKEGRKPNSNYFSPLYWTQSKTSCVPWQESWKWLAPNSELPVHSMAGHTADSRYSSHLYLNFHCQYHHQSPHQADGKVWVHREVPRCLHAQQEQTWCRVPCSHRDWWTPSCPPDPLLSSGAKDWFHRALTEVKPLHLLWHTGHTAVNWEMYTVHDHCIL